MALDTCMFCSLHQGAIVCGNYAMLVYGAALGITVWWIAGEDGAVSPGFYVLAILYFSLFLMSVCLILALSNQRSTSMLMLWLVLMTLLVFPECGLNIYLDIIHLVSFMSLLLGFENPRGLGFFIFFVVRVVLNVLCMICIYSLYLAWTKEKARRKLYQQFLPSAFLPKNPQLIALPAPPGVTSGAVVPVASTSLPMLPWYPSSVTGIKRLATPDGSLLLEPSRGEPVAKGQTIEYTPAEDDYSAADTHGLARAGSAASVNDHASVLSTASVVSLPPRLDGRMLSPLMLTSSMPSMPVMGYSSWPTHPYAAVQLHAMPMPASWGYYPVPPPRRLRSTQQATLSVGAIPPPVSTKQHAPATVSTYEQPKSTPMNHPTAASNVWHVNGNAAMAKRRYTPNKRRSTDMWHLQKKNANTTTNGRTRTGVEHAKTASNGHAQAFEENSFTHFDTKEATYSNGDVHQHSPARGFLYIQEITDS